MWHAASAPVGHESTITPVCLPSSDASVMAMQIHVMSRMGQAARVRTTQRRAPARGAPPVTAETATSTRCGWRNELWAKGPTAPGVRAGRRQPGPGRTSTVVLKGSYAHHYTTNAIQHCGFELCSRGVKVSLIDCF